MDCAKIVLYGHWCLPFIKCTFIYPILTQQAFICDWYWRMERLGHIIEALLAFHWQMNTILISCTFFVCLIYGSIFSFWTISSKTLFLQFSAPYIRCFAASCSARQSLCPFWGHTRRWKEKITAPGRIQTHGFLIWVVWSTSEVQLGCWQPHQQNRSSLILVKYETFFIQ